MDNQAPSDKSVPYRGERLAELPALTAVRLPARDPGGGIPSATVRSSDHGYPVQKHQPSERGLPQPSVHDFD